MVTAIKKAGCKRRPAKKVTSQINYTQKGGWVQVDEYKSAIEELREAQDYFDMAEPEQIDEAIYRLNAAELRASRVIREIKEAVK